MPAPISPSTRPNPLLPPLPQVVRAEGGSNDPTQRISLESTGHLRISGDATNNGFIPSRASLSFDGQSVSVPLSGGMSPYDTFKALEAAMPEGYKLRVVHQAGRDALVEVVSTTKFGPPNRPEPVPQPPRPDVFNPVPSRPVNNPPWLPAMPKVVETKGWSGDATQSISPEREGRLRIAGLAEGASSDPRINLYFDGKDVNVQLRAGMTPYETYQAIAAQMPEGYNARLVFQVPHSHADVLIEVTKRPEVASSVGGDWLK